MNKLSKFLFGNRSKLASLFMYAIHSDYTSYCTFARRSKITSHDIYTGLELVDIRLEESISTSNLHDVDFRKKTLRELFVLIKKEKETIIKDISYDVAKNTQN